MRHRDQPSPFAEVEADHQSGGASNEAELRMEKPEPPYTLDEISKLSRKSPRTLRRYIQSGELPAKKVGRTWLVSASVARDWLGELLGS